MEKKEIQLAKLFHDTYERLAPEFGYTTRGDTKEFNKNSSNGKLMVAVCKEVMTQELDKAREEGVEAGMVNAREMVSAFLDTLDVDKNEEEIRILRGINQLLEAITGLALKLKDNK